jgi:large subunit ribosomal protein L20
MSRVKGGVTAHKRHRKLVAKAKGYKLGRNSLFRLAKQALLKAESFSFRDRKNKKRTFRAHWIVVLNAAVSKYDMSYSQFINGLNKANITLNRRVLSELARNHPEEFAAIVEKVKNA